LHIDKRAPRILEYAEGASGDEMLTPAQLAAWLQCSQAWLSQARIDGTGPPFQRLGGRLVLYRRGGVRTWLRQRTYTSTSAYRKEPAR
jgi:hypothetical protein